MSKIGYFIKEGVRGMKDNLGTTFGSIVTIFLSLFLTGIIMVATAIVDNVTDSVEDQVNINVYISDDAAEDNKALDSLRGDLESIDGVASVSYTDKDKAMENFKETMASNPQIITQLDGENPLPASFTVELVDPQRVDEVAKEIMNMDSFKDNCDVPDVPSESIKYGQKAVDRLFSMTGIVKIAGIILVIMLVFVSFVFMNNTIRLAVMGRKREISIQRLVGASNGFIRGPFLAEGILHALIGIVLAIFAISVVCSIALPALNSGMSWLPIELTTPEYLLIYLLLILMGLVIGAASSMLAMRKYLKV